MKDEITEYLIRECKSQEWVRNFLKKPFEGIKINSLSINSIKFKNKKL